MTIYIYMFNERQMIIYINFIYVKWTSVYFVPFNQNIKIYIYAYYIYLKYKAMTNLLRNRDVL